MILKFSKYPAIVGLLSGAILLLMFLEGVVQRHALLSCFVFISFVISVIMLLPSKQKDISPDEMASIIERHLDGKWLYPQEWNDFVERPLHDKKLDIYRKRCDELDPLVNRPGELDSEAVSELRSLIQELRRASNHKG